MKSLLTFSLATLTAVSVGAQPITSNYVKGQGKTSAPAKKAAAATPKTKTTSKSKVAQQKTTAEPQVQVLKSKGNKTATANAVAKTVTTQTKQKQSATNASPAITTDSLGVPTDWSTGQADDELTLDSAEAKESSTTSPATAGKSSLKLTSTTEEKKSKFSGTWLAALSAGTEVTFDGTKEKADTAENKMTGVLGVQLGYNLTEALKLTFNAGATFASGYFLVTDETKGKPTNTISVSEAAANYDLGKHFSTKVGITRQYGVLHSPIVVYKPSFPTLRLTTTTGAKDDNKLELIAQAAVPNSVNSPDRSRQETGTPSMIGAALTGQAKTGAVELSGKLSGYQFTNLTSAIAKENVDGGNRVSAQSNPTATDVIYSFQNQFRGVDTSLDLGLNLSKSIKYTLGGAYTKNLAADEGFGVGTMWSTGFEFTFNENFVLIPSYYMFRVEPDTVVSSYSTFGTNKTGYGAGLKAKINKLFAINIEGGDTDMVYIRNDQYYGRSFSISLETEPIPF